MSVRTSYQKRMRALWLELGSRIAGLIFLLFSLWFLAAAFYFSRRDDYVRASYEGIMAIFCMISASRDRSDDDQT